MLRSILIAALVVVAGPAYASVFDGQIEEVIIGTNTLVAGGTRVSVRVAGRTNPCGSSLWFAYEYPDSGAGAGSRKTWTAALIAARIAGQVVRVEGTGTCDQHNIEIVNAIFLR